MPRNGFQRRNFRPRPPAQKNIGKGGKLDGKGKPERKGGASKGTLLETLKTMGPRPLHVGPLEERPQGRSSIVQRALTEGGGITPNPYQPSIPARKTEPLDLVGYCETMYLILETGTRTQPVIAVHTYNGNRLAIGPLELVTVLGHARPAEPAEGE